LDQGSAALHDCRETVNPALPNEVKEALEQGGRVVVYEFCISLIFITLRRPSSPIVLPPGNRGIIRGLPYCLISLVFGWWGIPWGVIYTPLTIMTNVMGGFDVSSRFREVQVKQDA
jgi:hypothetical protein